MCVCVKVCVCVCVCVGMCVCGNVCVFYMHVGVCVCVVWLCAYICGSVSSSFNIINIIVYIYIWELQAWVVVHESFMY